MIEVGRLCIKTAGRDAGQKCVVVELIDTMFVMIDGETRRRKCNILHLEPTKQVVELKKGASHSDVEKALDKIGVKARNTTPKKATERPKQIRAEQRKKLAEAEDKKPKKKEVKKVEEKEKTIESKTEKK